MLGRAQGKSEPMAIGCSCGHSGALWLLLTFLLPHVLDKVQSWSGTTGTGPELQRPQTVSAMLWVVPRLHPGDEHLQLRNTTTRLLADFMEESFSCLSMLLFAAFVLIVRFSRIL